MQQPIPSKIAVEDDETLDLDGRMPRELEIKPVEDGLLEANDLTAKLVEDDRGRKFVEDVAAGMHAEQARRMRPIEDAAALDPEDPDYHEKLAALVEEVEANLAATSEAVEDLKRRLPEKHSSKMDRRARERRLAHMEERRRC